MLEFRVLGPLEVARDGRLLRLGSAKQRTLLVVLLSHPNETVSREVLVDELWLGEPPRSAPHTLEVYVHRLRKILDANGDDRIVTRPGGYALRLARGELDLHRFEELIEIARRSLAAEKPTAALAKLDEALALWRGPALADVAYDGAAREMSEQLEELRLAATEDRFDAQLALGRHAEIIPALSAAASRNRLRERFTRQLMIALYHTGRHAEALNTYREARRFLVAELGLEPSPELRQLERAILAQDLHGGPARADGLPRNGRFHATEDEAGAPRRTLVAPLEYLWRHRFGRIVGAMVVVAAVAVGVLIVAIGSRSNRRRTVPPSAIGLIDPQRNEVVATAPFPAVPGTLATGVGSIWVGSLTDQTITIVNPRTREVEHTVSFNSYPSSFAAGAGALWVFEDSLQPGEAAAITRVASDGTVTRDEIPKSAKFHNPYHNPNTCGLTGTGQQRSKITVGGGRVWFVCVDGTLGSFDPQSNRMHVGTYEGRGSPTGIAFNSDGVWVTDAEHNLLLQIDPASHATVREFSVGAEPRGIIATRGSVWVAGFAADNVTRVELPGGGLAADQTAIRVGRGPTSIAYGQGAVWVANADRTISRIDPQSNRVTATIPIGNVPNGIAADEHGVWVTTGQ